MFICCRSRRIIFYVLFFLGCSSISVASTELRTSEYPPLVLPVTSDNTVTLFSIYGSNTIGASLAPALVKAYLAKKNVENVRTISVLKNDEVYIKGELSTSGQSVQILIKALGSSTGFKALRAKKSQIAAASRAIKSEELELLRDFGDMRSVEHEHILGIDGLAIIVNKNSSQVKLTIEQLRKVFAGEFTNWSQLGETEGNINLYARDRHSGTWDTFKRLVLGKESQLSSQARRYDSNDQLSKAISEDENGIGFVGIASVGLNKALRVSDGSNLALQPSRLNIATEDYALSRRLYLYSASNENQWVNEFIAYSQNIEGQNIVADTGFVSQNVSPLNTTINENASQSYKLLTENAQRLSVNFRFTQGSASLDTKASKDMQRLIDFMEDKKSNKRLVLIGFGDDRKSQKRTQLISKLRAMAIRRELVREGIYPAETVGFGSSSKIASQQSLKNRRVEVWLKN